MNRAFIVLGFIILVVGGLLYTLLPYTTTVLTEMQTDGLGMEYAATTNTTTTGNNPIGTVVMFIGFTVVVVGLFYKPEVAKAHEMKQENQ
jgi:flagellin-like protein